MRQEDLQAGKMFTDQSIEEESRLQTAGTGIEDVADYGDVGLGTSTTQFEKLSKGKWPIFKLRLFRTGFIWKFEKGVK